MIERLEIIEQRYNEINKLLLDPSVVSDINKYRELSKELSSIEETVKTYHEYNKTLSDLSEAHEMVKDPELADFAREEVESLQNKKVDVRNRPCIINGTNTWNGGSTTNIDLPITKLNTFKHEYLKKTGCDCRNADSPYRYSTN